MKKKMKEAQRLGSLGGLARAKNLTAKQLSDIGKKAVAARIAKRNAEKIFS